MPKDTKTLGNNKARACESLGFVHKKRLCQRFDTTSSWKRINGKSYHLAYSSTSSITGTSTLGRSTGKVMMMSSAPVFSVM